MKIPINKLKTANESHFDSNNDPDYAKFHRHITPFKVLAIIFFLLYIICATGTCGIFIWLSVLPLKYLIILITISLFFTLVFAFFTFKKSFKKSQKITKTLKIVTIIFEITLTALFVVIFFYLNHTMNFMKAIRASEYQIETYSVIVKKDSIFNDIEDLHYGTIATYNDNSSSYDNAVQQLSSTIKYKQIEKENFADTIDAIIDEDINAILMKSSLAKLATEVFTNFKSEEYRTIYTITTKIPIQSLSASDIDTSKNSFNIYISGIDTFGDIATVSRSDVNMIITINPRSHRILLTSIPRDYYVQLHGTTGLKDKLTHSGLYGINTTIATIEDLLGIKINYYIRVNFDSTVSLIDAIDGIDITPDATFVPKADWNCYYANGVTSHVYGRCALAYARERQAYGTGDMHRIQNQQEVFMAIFNKLTSSKTLLTEYTNILSSLGNSLETNIPSSEIYRIINLQLDSMPSWAIERISLTGTHIDAPTYTISTEYLYVFEPDPESIAEVTAKIQEVMAEN